MKKENKEQVKAFVKGKDEAIRNTEKRVNDLKVIEKDKHKKKIANKKNN